MHSFFHYPSVVEPIQGTDCNSCTHLGENNQENCSSYGMYRVQVQKTNCPQKMQAFWTGWRQEKKGNLYYSSTLDFLYVNCLLNNQLPPVRKSWSPRNARIISGMCIVLWPIRCASEPQEKRPNLSHSAKTQK